MRKFLFLFLVILAPGLPAAMIAGTFPMGRAKARPLEEGAALALAASPAVPGRPGPEYSIQAIRYASADDEVAGLVMGAPKGEKINIAMVVWLIRGGGHNILFDSGYHRETICFPKRRCGFKRRNTGITRARLGSSGGIMAVSIRKTSSNWSN